jgi:ureidoacrylate peracid hydrolase
MKAKETAVIMIEFQNEFCKHGGKLYDGVKSEMERQNTLAHAVKLQQEARQRGCLIVMTPFVFDVEYAKFWKPEGIVGIAAAAGAFRRGDWGTEIIDELKPAPDDAIVHGKATLCGFNGSNLDMILKSAGIRNCILCGFLTNVCVEATARTAYDRGYRVIVAKDACAAGSREQQEYPEKYIFPLLGKVLTVDEILAQIESAGSESLATAA